MVAGATEAVDAREPPEAERFERQEPVGVCVTVEGCEAGLGGLVERRAVSGRVGVVGAPKERSAVPVSRTITPVYK